MTTTRDAMDPYLPPSLTHGPVQTSSLGGKRAVDLLLKGLLVVCIYMSSIYV